MNFWMRALGESPATRALGRIGLSTPAPEPEQPEGIDVSALTMDEFQQHRGDIGLGETSDFVGVSGWTRQQAVRNVFHIPTPLEEYEESRGELGMSMAPQASAMPDIAAFKAAQQAAVKAQSFRRQ